MMYHGLLGPLAVADPGVFLTPVANVANLRLAVVAF